VATLHYAMNGTGSDGRRMVYDTNVSTPPQFYLWKSAILERIQIPQLSLVNWHCYRFYTAL